MIPEVDRLFRHLTPAAYAVAQYCASSAAHRLLKIGWEKEIHFLSGRRVILLSMFLPPHSRPALLDLALAKAHDENDQEVIALLMAQAAAFQKMKEMKASA